nr:hypothetical protein Iba_chr13aCG8410 [Ipomoea batatas]GMD78260.1 hypothetical protein Iba_chr13cCG11260 [Ipomoea batatas]
MTGDESISRNNGGQNPNPGSNRLARRNEIGDTGTTKEKTVTVAPSPSATPLATVRRSYPSPIPKKNRLHLLNFSPNCFHNCSHRFSLAICS